MKSLPETQQRLMAEIGPRWAEDIRQHSDLVKEAYEPVLAAVANDGIGIERNIAYGAHERQVLDVFLPPGPKVPRPVVVFVHGGGYVRGDKATPNGLYDNVLYWFAKQGFVGVNVEYRLAPEAAYPAGIEDVALAMRWVDANIESFGGKRDAVLLLGHSAGGTHVGSYVFDPAWTSKGPQPAAAVLVSARLQADVLPENPNAAGVEAYFSTDPGTYETRSPMAHAGASKLPVLIAIAEFENPLLDIYGLEFAHRVASARRRAPRFLQMTGHNHMSIMAHFNTGEDDLGREIVGFFAAYGGPSLKSR